MAITAKSIRQEINSMSISDERKETLLNLLESRDFNIMQSVVDDLQKKLLKLSSYIEEYSGYDDLDDFDYIGEDIN